jgi:hypothetical protein
MNGVPGFDSQQDEGFFHSPVVQNESWIHTESYPIAVGASSSRAQQSGYEPEHPRLLITINRLSFPYDFTEGCLFLYYFDAFCSNDSVN